MNNRLQNYPGKFNSIMICIILTLFQYHINNLELYAKKDENKYTPIKPNTEPRSKALNTVGRLTPGNSNFDSEVKLMPVDQDQY